MNNFVHAQSNSFEVLESHMIFTEMNRQQWHELVEKLNEMALNFAKSIKDSENLDKIWPNDDILS